MIIESFMKQYIVEGKTRATIHYTNEENYGF